MSFPGEIGAWTKEMRKSATKMSTSVASDGCLDQRLIVAGFHILGPGVCSHGLVVPLHWTSNGFCINIAPNSTKSFHCPWASRDQSTHWGDLCMRHLLVNPIQKMQWMVFPRGWRHPSKYTCYVNCNSCKTACWRMLNVVPQPRWYISKHCGAFHDHETLTQVQSLGEFQIRNPAGNRLARLGNFM